MGQRAKCLGPVRSFHFVHVRALGPECSRSSLCSAGAKGFVRFWPAVAKPRQSPYHASHTRPLQHSARPIACVFSPVASCCRSYRTLSVELNCVLSACVYFRRRLHLETVFKEGVKEVIAVGSDPI